MLKGFFHSHSHCTLKNNTLGHLEMSCRLYVVSFRYLQSVFLGIFFTAWHLYQTGLIVQA